MKIAGPLQGVSRSEEHQGGGPLAWSLRVIGFEGNNVWLSQERCLLCAREHLRQADHEEMNTLFRLKTSQGSLH